MATQLILYPQNYNGYAFSSTPLLNQYAANITFTSHEISTTDMSSAGLTFAVILLGTPLHKLVIGDFFIQHLQQHHGMVHQHQVLTQIIIY